ncbi:MAG TPA: SprT-like domain-containing protein [Gammaproteobacteria bacterium]|nr:SprT-like domain-containing protein [Gammaproteobacteria bacterium]
MDKIAQELAPGIVVKYRTDDDDNLGEYEPETNTIWLSEQTLRSDPEVQRFVLLHELCHALVTKQHDKAFYKVLTELIPEHNVSWLTAAKIEQIIPNSWYENMTDDEKKVWSRIEG